MLLQRVLTVLVIAPLFFWVVLKADLLWFDLFWLALAGLAAREWGNLLRWKMREQWIFAGVVSAMAGIGLLLINYMLKNSLPGPQILFAFLCLACLLWLFIVPYALYRYAQQQRLNLPNPVLAVAGAVMLLAFVWATAEIYRVVGGRGLLGLFIIVWCADIGAYFSGRQWGKHKLAENISPKKTLEGFAGGFIAAMIAATALIFWVDLPVKWYVFLPLTAVVVIYATVGDLWESVLKRRIDIKDSSQILPGHGGILDRIDSWLSAMVLWAAGFLFFHLY